MFIEYNENDEITSTTFGVGMGEAINATVRFVRSDTPLFQANAPASISMVALLALPLMFWRKITHKRGKTHEF